MVDTSLAQLILRNRALTLSVATTGSVTLSATATGYARTAGSFLTDGMQVGQEVTPSGFASNTAGVITSVSALAMGIAGGRTAQAAGAGRTLTVGLPALRAWENLNFTPISGRPFIEEDFVPATTSVVTIPAEGAHLEETGLYFLKWYGLQGVGILGLRKSVDALKRLYAPGTRFNLSDGTSLRIPIRSGPYAGQIRPIDGGWAVVTLTIPWLAWSTNAIAA